MRDPITAVIKKQTAPFMRARARGPDIVLMCRSPANAAGGFSFPGTVREMVSDLLGSHRLGMKLARP